MTDNLFIATHIAPESNMHYANITALKTAITEARSAAKLEAQRSCGKGALFSRGAWVRCMDDKGNVIGGEADSIAFEPTAKGFADLENTLRYGNFHGVKVAAVEIQGGFDWALNPRDYADGAYDCWVSEWAIDLATGAQSVA